MTSKTHATIGIMTGLIFLQFNGHQDIYRVMSGAIIGSLLNDLDSKKSDPSQIFPVISRVVDKFTKHRGATHYSLPALFFALYFFMNNSNPAILCIGLGSLSHTFIDELTLLTKIKCQSKGEGIIHFAVWVFNFALIINILTNNKVLEVFSR